MKRFFLLPGIVAFVFLSVHPAMAQNSSPSSQAGTSRSEAPYLLPQTIFVGDSGRLVVPLSQVYLGVEPFVLEAFGMLNESPDLVIRRIELERRGPGSRLLIDFIPYAPGVLSIQPMDFYSLLPGLPKPESEEARIPSITGLKVQVASILNPSQMTLSDPAPPLAAPGTSFLIYGFVILVLVILFFGAGISLWGRRHFTELWERFRRRRLIRLMLKFLRRLRLESGFEKEGKAGFYLTILSGEFREFLSLFTRVNCYSFSAEEFLELPLGYDGNMVVPMLRPVFLCGLFKSWDTLRFSGQGMEMSDLFQALAATECFVAALDKAEKEKPLQRTARDSLSGQSPAESSESAGAALSSGGEIF